MTRRIANLIVRVSSWFVPADARHDWRAEWLAEIRARTSGGAVLAFACGAPLHALWLQKEQWRPEMVSADLRFGWRQVRRNPGIALAAVLTLAIGIGATTAIFSVVYGVLLKPLPFREPSRLVQLWEANPLFNWTEANIAPGNLISWLERNKTLESVAWYMGSDTRSGGRSTLSYGAAAEPVRVTAQQVSVNFFDVLGTRPLLGRAFLPGEDVAGKHRVTLLSHAFWRRQFAGDPAIVNRQIQLNGRDYLVVGVLPESFSFDSNAPDCWMPMVLNFAEVRETRRAHYLRAVARLRPGASVDQARADIVAIAKDLEREYPGTNTQMSAGVGPLTEWFVGPARRPLLAFLGAVALLLLIACVNVANLFLARTLERSREMTLRAALGANRLRLVRQLISEAGVIATAGAAAGLALAYGALRLFLRFAPEGLPRLDQAGLNMPVMAFAISITVLVTMVIGLVPAWQASRTDLRGALGDGGRTTQGPGRIRRVLVAAEVSLAVVLLVGAALTLRSFVALVSVRPAFAVSGLVSAQMSLPGIRYGDTGKSAQFFETLASRLRAEPGVIAAGAVSVLPLEGNEWTGQLFVEGRPEVHGREVRHKTVTMGYLETLGLPVIAGRVFAGPDVLNGQVPIVVNQALARAYFPQGTAVGSRIAQDTPDPKTQWNMIIGVVADEPQDGLGIPAQPEIYDAELLQDAGKMAVLVRSTLPPQDAMALLRKAAREKDPQVALFDVRSMDEGVWRSVARERLAMSLAAMFAISALLLAAVGIYGVAAHGVAQRTREIGVRVAFGATRSNVVTMLLRDELSVVVVGLAVGGVAAFLMARVVSAMLFQTTASDWVSYAAGASLLVASAVLACIVPARRALGVDPIVALRND